MSMYGGAGERELQDALSDELAGAQALRRLLQREAEVLATLRQAEDLSEVTEQKRTAVAGLHAAAHRRDAALAALGLVADASGMEAFMAAEASAPLRALWRRLQDEIRACADLNRRNELLNQGGQRRVRQLLRLMRGEPAEPLTYERLART